MYKFLSIFFCILFSQNTQARSTISGKQISEILKSWLDDKGKPANFEILETIKYPYCETPNLIISDIEFFIYSILSSPLSSSLISTLSIYSKTLLADAKPL